MKSELDAKNSSRSYSRPEAQSIAVIGGSAAGLFTAALLARRGFPVKVFERIDALEPEARTLIVTNHMRGLLGRAAESSIVNEIRRFELFTDGRAATISLKNPDLIVERRALIQGMAEEARSAGATLEFGKRFRSLRPNSKGLVFEVERSSDGSLEEVHADTIVEIGRAHV